MTRLRSAVFLVHLTTACVAGLVIFFLAATGFMLAWQKQAIAWQERGYRVEPPSPGAAALPLDRLVAIAASMAGKAPVAVSVQSDPDAAVDIEIGRGSRLLIDGYSGAVLGPGAQRTRAFFDDVTALHRWFGAPPEDHGTARAVKGAFDLALLLMIATGAYLWLPRVWSWERLTSGISLRFGLSGRARDWNLHNVLGFWAALPLAVIVFTGAILAYGWATNLLYLATGSPLPRAVSKVKTMQRHSHRKDAVPGSSGAASLQLLLDRAERQASGWRSIRVVLPQPGDRTVAVVIDFLDDSRPDRQTDLVFNRETGAVLQRSAFFSLSRGRQLRSFAKYIHTGEAGGVAGETVAGLASLACCILVWTGLTMAVRRLRTLRSRAPRESRRVELETAETVAGSGVRST